MLQETLGYIQQAEDAELSQIIQAIIERYRHIHPDWEIMFLSLSKYDDQERSKILANFFSFLQNHGM